MRAPTPIATRRHGRAAARAALVALAVAGVLPPAAAGHHGGPSYEGHYANSFVAGKARDGRTVAIVAGHHVEFPYHDPGSSYDQVAVLVEGEEPMVATGRPALRALPLRTRERRTWIRHRDRRFRVGLLFESVRLPQRYEGDPFDLGDFMLRQEAVPDDRQPGLVYTPYQLRRLVHGKLVLRGGAEGARRIRLSGLHGQAEEGTIDAPTDARFRSAYDYLAAASADGGRPYSYVGFEARALHGGMPDGVLGPYFAMSASDDFTLEGGRIIEGNPHEAPGAFDNTGGPPAGARGLGRWRVDLGPGVLHRAIVRLRDGSGGRLVAFSETIKEDDANGP